jgi:predicted dithiol-disulfide oxidoreductase (DUF899 family)
VIDRPQDEIRAPEATEGAPLPPVTDRASWQAQIDEMAVREKAHTREGDAIAAARRRLPMVVYYHMWHDGKPAEDQCEGCTFFNGQVSELSYLHARDVTYATFSQGPYEESAAYRRFMGYDMPWYSARESEEALLAGRWFGMFVSYLRDGDRAFETYWTTGRGTEAMAPAYGILDRTIYGRQEPFEDSPEGWPQHWVNNGSQFRTNGRPSAQWSRLAAGRSDDLTASPTS